MLNFIEVPVEREARSFTTAQYVLFDGHYPIFTMGLQLKCAITQDVYLWLQPSKYLKPVHLRGIIAALDEYVDFPVHAHVANDDVKARRFASAVGFTPRETVAGAPFTRYERRQKCQA